MVTTDMLRQDPQRRWNEQLTEQMEASVLQDYLLSAAQELAGQEEWESAYDVYRELVWRFPDELRGWRGLAQMAQIRGFAEEAAVAETQVQRQSD
jgi:hypothetical protein